MSALLLPALAWRALRRNAMRTLLTMLGVIIGVGAAGDGAELTSVLAAEVGFWGDRQLADAEHAQDI